MQRIFIILFLLSTIQFSYGSIIEELDEPPEGAHEGQITLGLYLSFGYPIGSAITAEESFLDNSAYTFTDSGTTKALWVSHLAFSFGLTFEYMPIDYLGIRARYRQSMVIQRTLFGSEYDNTSETLLNNYALMVGPSIHFYQ